MKKVGLYFGSFNPVHIGHLGLANYLIDHNIVDELWFVISPCNPLKQQTELLDEHIRLKMLNLAIVGNEKLKTSDVEFSMSIPSYTIDTLEVLEARFPQKRFSLIIGSDNALLFDRWKNSQEIIDRFPVLVYPRRGYDFEQVARRFPQMQLLSTPYYDISSTEIRQNIAENKDVSTYLHPAVYRYILEKELYR
jgi:nicotinate-nucleotide adenylyltransferase